MRLLVVGDLQWHYLGCSVSGLHTQPFFLRADWARRHLAPARVIVTLSGGTGNVTQQSINSILVRQDGMSLRGRGGTFASAGQYPGELNMGNYDSIFEAVMRGTWTPGGSLAGTS